MTAARDPLLDLHVQVRLDLFNHGRFDALLEHLDVDLDPRLAYASLILLWVEAMKRQQDGDLTDWSALSVARASQWPKEGREQWLEALIGSGFVERVDDRLTLHNWSDFSGGVFVQRKAWADKKAQQRAGVSPGRPGDIPETVVPNGEVVPETSLETSPGTSFNAKLRAKVVNRVNRVNEDELGATGPDPGAPARTHEASEEEIDEFLATLDDERDDEHIEMTTRALSNSGDGTLIETDTRAGPDDSGAVPDDAMPTLVRPANKGRDRRARPADAGELAELMHHWCRAFGDVGADVAFRRSWERAMVGLPFGSAERINEWLDGDFSREKARVLPPPGQPAIGALVVAPAVDPNQAWMAAKEHELRAALIRQGMAVPDWLQEEQSA